MIEGIDYYPKKKKYKSEIKYWTLSLIAVLLIAYWYFNGEQNLETSTSSIVINDLQIEPVTNPIPITIKPSQIQQKTSEILENLDEVLQSQTIQ